jgi:hypothetical protein
VSSSAVLRDGLAEPSMPRDNGAPVFDAPWQGRALALAVLTVERSGREWDDFRACLIRAVADDPERPYWDSWVVALEQFVAVIGVDPGAGSR